MSILLQLFEGLSTLTTPFVFKVRTFTGYLLESYVFFNLLKHFVTFIGRKVRRVTEHDSGSCEGSINIRSIIVFFIDK